MRHYDMAEADAAMQTPAVDSKIKVPSEQPLPEHGRSVQSSSVAQLSNQEFQRIGMDAMANDPSGSQHISTGTLGTAQQSSDEVRREYCHLPIGDQLGSSELTNVSGPSPMVERLDYEMEASTDTDTMSVEQLTISDDGYAISAVQSKSFDGDYKIPEQSSSFACECTNNFIAFRAQLDKFIRESSDKDEASVTAGQSSSSEYRNAVGCEGELACCHASVCNCWCTCESYEEMKAFDETEESMPVCVHCEECGDDECMSPEIMCTCDDSVVVVRPLYSVHCCTCGVQLAPDDEPPSAESLDDQRNNNIVEAISDDEAGGRVQSVPPPPPPLPPTLFSGSSLTRMLAPTPAGSAPLLRLRAITCDDGSSHDTRLHEAARAGQTESLRNLLKDENLRAKCIIARTRPLMATPLREAVVGGNTACVKVLLEAGADVDAVDVKGQTPLFVAASLSHHHILKLLLEAGADPDGSRCNSCTPLLLAVREGCLPAVQSLMAAGADSQLVFPHTTCTPGWPLQHSVVYRHLACFLALLKGGAKPTLTGVWGDRETIDASVLKRLSIIRTALRHASDMPEFVWVYREFGGTLDRTEDLPEDLQRSLSPARLALQEAQESPLRLTSLCRLSLTRCFGAALLPEVAAQAGLPANLRAFLAFQDLDVVVARAASASFLLN
ncbi:uncharacterized protein LOC108678266 [Hyalella azteca]|uniref:Uncharacterized protein LOC108678266 n=1 Tax=Hyalella azteca TaxID=294128 RepID=A0A8B7PAB6_HYAAZ|nr:uncharacterized protein LOC108678266 [Hyalella azteca]XP_018022136.1 uncharacterized protein LOC108678266 [Hyalella azteca]